MKSRKKRASERGGKVPARVVSEKVAKTYRLSPSKIAAAQRILGVATATAAIETALDMVVFRQELLDGTGALLGVHIADGGE